MHLHLFLVAPLDTHECVKALQKVAKLLKVTKNCLAGLHLCKCVVNAARCFSMSYQGENFGVYILRALRNCGDKCAQML